MDEIITPFFSSRCGVVWYSCELFIGKLPMADKTPSDGFKKLLVDRYISDSPMLGKLREDYDWLVQQMAIERFPSAEFGSDEKKDDCRRLAAWNADVWQ